MERSEQEVVISICADEKEWTVYSTYPVMTRKFKRIVENGTGRETHHQGGAKFFIPKGELRIALKRKVVMSEEDRARRAALARTYFGHKATSDEDEDSDDDALDTEQS